MFIRRPHPSLRSLVACYWYSSGDPVAHQRERALPTGTTELVFNLCDATMRIFRDDRDRTGYCFRDTVICGPHSGYFVLDTSQNGPVIGIHFHPGGAEPFLRTPAFLLLDTHLSLEDVWGADASRLADRLRSAGRGGADHRLLWSAKSQSIHHLFDIIETELLARLTRTTPHEAVAQALWTIDNAPAITRIAEVRQATGYSPKRFIELFRHSVGLTPKVYCRIQRFQTVIRTIANGGKPEWARVAADCGYSDQPHLNREFAAFSGVTPGEYKPVSPDRASHSAV